MVVGALGGVDSFLKEIYGAGNDHGEGARISDAWNA
jgi:hypothetical protein